MLVEIFLSNFRGFEEHSLELRPTTIAVGRNNAGKSSLVEALRLISIVTDRLENLNFRNPPSWTQLPRRSPGVAPAINNIGINFEGICHRYSDPPAKVTARFEGGEMIEFRVTPDGEGFATIFDRDGSVVRTKGQARSLDFPRVAILPQVAPFDTDERLLREEYVRRNLASPLAPRHFRNQLAMHPGPYRDFRRLAEESWPGLQIRTLEGARTGGTLRLTVRDRDFVAEVALMGHGLQMWMQTIWFISRAQRNSTVVLDEPDVYMHPDLQRKMVRVVSQRFPQVVIATHSIEIMAEVEPQSILIVDRRRPTSQYANSEPGVQVLIDRLGGIHNIQLARLWNARRCLFVEGGDLGILRLFQSLLFPDTETPLDDIPNTPIGGWGGWNYAVGSSLFIRNAFGQAITVYCILDSDYHIPELVEERLADAAQKNVSLHIWSRKELENYLVVPTAIARVITSRLPEERETVANDEVASAIDQICQDLQEDAADGFATSYQSVHRDHAVSTANRAARRIVSARWNNLEQRIGVVSGKEILSQLSSWSQEAFGVSFGPMAIARAITAEEVSPEIREVLQAIENIEEFHE